MASISAVSVLGRIGTHCAPRKSGESDLSGVMETNSMPASFARRSHVCMVWAPAPPEVTWPFLVASPPKARIRRVCLTIADQSVTWPARGGEGADPARKTVWRGREAVVGAGAAAPPARKGDPPQQAAGMVDAARRRPAIGAAEDRGMAERLAHARKLGGDGGERLVPGYLVEAIGAGAFLSLAPAVANGGPPPAQRRRPPPARCLAP